MANDPNLSAVTPLTEKQEQTVYAPDQQWSNDFATKVAVQDFSIAEAYRQQNHDWRFQNADRLYEGWKQQKYWEGTRIPRACVPVYLAFEQIESMLPKIVSAIFGDNPWFQADPLGQTTAEQARQWRNVILDQMDQTGFREQLRKCVKSGLIYGNGIGRLSWLSQELKKANWRVRWNGGERGFQRVLEKTIETEIINRPEFEYISIKDFYIDPNCEGPNPQDGEYCFTRQLCSVGYLSQLRGLSEFKIPSDVDLIELAKLKPTTQGDMSKSTQESYRLGSWYPAIDQTVNPAGLRVEVIERISADRIVWVLNREVCVLNMPNSFGFIPIYSTFYADMLDRFYAMGVCDVLDGEQRLQGALLDGRLDEVSLNIHRPVVKRRSINTPAYMLRQRPGQVWDAENPKEDFVFPDPPRIMQEAYLEQQFSDVRAQKITGVTDLAMLGTPAAGGNSANRTATGVGVQAQASASRLQYIVENVEDSFVEPILNDTVKLNQLYPPIGTSLAETIALSKVRVSMRASAKMQSRMALLQTLPLILQTLGNPGFISELALQGETVNWKELAALITDMTGARLRADLIRPLTPEEKQARQQQGQAEAQLKMQMQRERIQGQSAIQQQKLLAEGRMQEGEAQNEDEQDQLYALLELAKEMMKLKAAKEKKPANGAD